MNVLNVSNINYARTKTKGGVWKFIQPTKYGTSAKEGWRVIKGWIKVFYGQYQGFAIKDQGFDKDLGWTSN